jgi:hypothetical protein
MELPAYLVSGDNRIDENARNPSLLYILHCIQVPKVDISWLRNSDGQMESSLFVIYVKILQLLSAEVCAASKENPWEILSPFIREVGACWLEKSSQYRDISIRTIYSPAVESTNLLFLEQLQQGIDDLRYMTGMIDTLFGGPLGQRKSPIQRDFAHVLHRYEAMYGVFRERLNYQSSMASLEESRLGIQQNQSLKRLTELAFVFIPLSFVT